MRSAAGIAIGLITRDSGRTMARLFGGAVLNPRRAVCLLAVLVLACSPLALAQGTYTQIDYPGALLTTPLGINTPGDVVGTYYDTADVEHGFLLSGGTFTTIDFPGATSTVTTGLNDAGQMVGYYQVVTSTFHAFLFDGSNFTTIDFPGSYGTLAMGINNSTQVAGYYYVKPNHAVGFELSGGNFTTVQPPGRYADAYLNGINNLGDFTGGLNHTPTSPGQSFHLNLSYGVYTSVAFPGAAWTLAWGLNDNNLIVGYYPLSASRESGFVFIKGKYYAIRVPDARSTVCIGINASNQIVGQFQDSTGNYHGYLRTP